MKSGLMLKNKQGFTIVEVLIVLAVSGAFLVSALSLIAGSQNKTLFNQAINDAQQQIDMLANNVANGYYPQTTKVGGCKKSTSGSYLDFSDPAVERGTNGNCTFLGRVIQFTTDETATVYSVAGLRLTDEISPVEVTSMNKAMPTTLLESQTITWKSGIKVGKLTYKATLPPPAVVPKDTGAIGFFTGFGTRAVGGSSDLQAGGLSADFVPIAGSDRTTPNLPANIKATGGSDFRTKYEADKNPAGGIEICFNSGTTNQRGIITIGGANKTATSTLIIKKGSC